MGNHREQLQMRGICTQQLLEKGECHATGNGNGQAFEQELSDSQKDEKAPAKNAQQPLVISLRHICCCCQFCITALVIIFDICFSGGGGISSLFFNQVAKVLLHLRPFLSRLFIHTRSPTA